MNTEQTTKPHFLGAASIAMKVAAHPRSFIDGIVQARHFRDVRRYCMFLGSGRSGHTLVGAMVNAHPHAVIAHELDALGYVDVGVNRNQLYSLILRRDRRFGRKRRINSGYSYEIPGQWAGRFEQALVMGDKRGEASTIRLEQKPWLLDRLRSTVGVPVLVIHHVRNPYDNITTEAKKAGCTLEAAAAVHFHRARTVIEVLASIDPAHQLRTYHEDLVFEPQGTLRSIIDFLGLEPIPEHLDACVRLVFPSARKMRTSVDWPASLVESVAAQIQEFEHLRRYRFED